LNRALFLADEIQSGLGRFGRLFACDWEGVRPDMALIGKVLSGGLYPASAVLASREVLGVFRPGDHGSMFGGNPLACAVARAALRVIREEKLCERSAELGEYIKGRLQRIESPHIKEVRGRGLLCKETHQHVIRFAPPLVVKKEELDWALEQIEAVLS
jgi:ornithine--oxo-acid transaminase